MERIGTLETVCRYPVKSMAGEEVGEAFVGFSGSWATAPMPSSGNRVRAAFPGSLAASRRI